MKNNKTAIILLCSVVLLVNLGYSFTEWIKVGHVAVYQVVCDEEKRQIKQLKGMGSDCCHSFRSIELYVKKSISEQCTVYRMEKVNILEFWKWGDYLFKRKWRAPYYNEGSPANSEN